MSPTVRRIIIALFLCGGAAATAVTTGAQPRLHGHQRAGAPADPCHLVVPITAAAEKRMGGALYAGPLPAEAAGDAGHMGVGEAMPVTDAAHGAGGGKAMEDAHMVHEPQLGGHSFFMAPNKLHHLEPLYSDECGFRVVIYNAFSQPIRVDRFRAFVRIIPAAEDEPELIRFLTPSTDGAMLRTAGALAVSRPLEVELYVKFPEAESPELFNVLIPASATR